MVALKGRGVDTYLARLEPRAHVVLIYGPDVGLVNERARAVVARALGPAADDPFQAVVLSGEALAGDAAKLADELYAIPMFGGGKAVRVRAAGDALAPVVAPILKSPAAGAMLVLEAGDLKPASALRKLVEGSPDGVAIPCYRDAGGDLARLVEDELAAVGAKATPEARALIVGLIGGDRAASRAELQKLALYAMGQEVVEEADVLAVLGDASLAEVDDLVDAAFDGGGEAVASLYRRLTQAGGDPAQIAGAALRRVDTLTRLSLKLEAGRTSDAALAALRPPPHFKRRDALLRAVKRWPRAALDDVAQRLHDAVLLTRQTPAVALSGVERTLLAIASRGGGST